MPITLMVGDWMTGKKIGPFFLALTGPGQEGFAHDCLVAGTNKTMGFTFYQIEEFDVERRKVRGKVAAVVWMPIAGAQELHRQLGEALTLLEHAADSDVIRVDHTPRQRSVQ